MVDPAPLRGLPRSLREQRSLKLTLHSRFKATFLEGLAYCIPAVITVWFFYQILTFLYSLVSEIIGFLFSFTPLQETLRVPITILGVFLTLLLVLLVGLLFETFLGKLFRTSLDSLVRRIPFVSSIYDVFQQLATSVFAKTDTLSSPVLVPFPHPGAKTVGFATGKAEADLEKYFPAPATKVFVPTTPIPTAGFLIFYPSSEVKECGMTREEAFTLILSGGLMEGGTAPNPQLQAATGKRSFFSRVGSNIFKGLLVLLPLFITAYITLRIFITLYQVFDIGAAFVSEESLAFFGPLIVLATFLATLLFIWFVGILVRTLLGKQIRRIIHGALRKVPPAESIYSTLRQLMKAIMKQSSTTDARVVLADFPFKGARVIGFSTGKAVRRFGGAEEELYKIFIPGTPNPTAGFFILAPKDGFVETSLTAEQGLKIALSGGILKSDGSSSDGR